MIRRRLVSRSGLVRGGRVVVMGLARVCHISDVSGVAISNSVSDGLGAAIGQQNMVLAVGGITITGFIGTKVDTVVVIIDIVSIVVLGGFFMVSGSRLVSGSGLVNGSRLVSRSGSGLVSRSGSGLVSRSRSGLVSRSGSGLVNTGSMMDRGVMDRGVVDRGMLMG